MKWRWPWQSVQVADLVERRRVGEHELAEKRIADLKATIAKQDADYTQLFGEYVALTRPPVVVKHENGTGPAKPRSAVAEAIRRESAGDPGLAGYLVKRAAELKAEGKTPEEIAEALSKWDSSENAGQPGGIVT